jgi:hypothetical protein
VAILPEADTDPICQGAALEDDCMTAMDLEFLKRGAREALIGVSTGE